MNIMAESTFMEHALIEQLLDSPRKLPDVRERLFKQGFDIVGSTPEEFDAYMHSEIARWRSAVKASHASVD